MAVTHAKVSVVADGGDSSLVQPSNWNANHTINDILPATDSTYDLGSAAFRWQHGYVEGIAFPATQVPSADANTLDDYQEGTWTPTLTFATPGDLNRAYLHQVGRYTKVGRDVRIHAYVQMSTFTHTTASGELRMGGLPFAAAHDHDAFAMTYSFMTVSQEQIAPLTVAGATYLRFLQAQRGIAQWLYLTTTHAPTATLHGIIIGGTYAAA